MRLRVFTKDSHFISKQNLLFLERVGGKSSGLRRNLFVCLFVYHIVTFLRNRSIEIHRLWQHEGKPRSGPTNDERCRVKAAYKKAIRSAQRKPKQSSWNRLHSSFLSKNPTEFRKSWKQMYSKSRSDLHTVINGFSSKSDITNTFKNHFIKVSPNSVFE